jgi:hypothetical protein
MIISMPAQAAAAAGSTAGISDGKTSKGTVGERFESIYCP